MINIHLSLANQSLHAQTIEPSSAQQPPRCASHLRHAQRAGRIRLEEDVLVGWINFQTFAIQMRNIIGHTGALLQNHSRIDADFQENRDWALEATRDIEDWFRIISVSEVIFVLACVNPEMAIAHMAHAINIPA